MIIKILFLLLIPVIANATDVTIPTTYATGGSVTASNLNGNFTALAQKVNGGLDNDNADTTNGYRFFEVKSSLPSAGTQGRTIFLTTDDTLNLDTGSAYVKSVVTTSTPAQGDVIYYNGTAWADLAAGTSGQFLKTQGAAANPTWALPGDLSITSQASGDIIYFNGTNWVRLAAGTAGTVLETGTPPSWVNALSGVLDYGSSASASTARQATALKVAFGAVSVTGSSSQAITNLAFTSSSSYHCNCTYNTDTAVSEDPLCVPDSGAQMTIHNDQNTRTISWFCLGV